MIRISLFILVSIVFLGCTNSKAAQEDVVDSGSSTNSDTSEPGWCEDYTERFGDGIKVVTSEIPGRFGVKTAESVNYNTFVSDSAGNLIYEECEYLGSWPDYTDFEDQLAVPPRCDGTESWVQSRQFCNSFEYDVSGLPTTMRHDDACDGVIDLCRGWDYDSDGNLLNKFLDYDCDGELRECELKTYDAAGRVLSEGLDRDCDGQRDTGCLSYSFDAYGNEILYSYDWDCDGVTTKCIQRAFNADGKLTFFSEGALCDAPAECKSWEYDDAGNLTNHRVDQCVPGSVSVCDTYTLDSNGQWFHLFKDANCDGLLPECTPNCDQCTIREVDQSGNALMSGIDDGCDGVVERNCRERSFDTDGNVLSEELDLDCDGIPDRHCNSYAYDSAGRVILKNTDPECDGTSKCEGYKFDNEGRQLSHFFDYECDGVSDMCAAREYNEDGRVIALAEGSECDSGIYYCRYTTYDDDGTYMGYISQEGVPEIDKDMTCSGKIRYEEIFNVAYCL